ncbi:unnamed protein product [Penicillium salamii]|nr:unnamed protein product [Penicillium salamii]CAG8373126.1 unnamed protein product [Penicillium salamii]
MPPRNIPPANDPNLNLLGTREPHIYGSTTLYQLESAISARASQHNLSVTCFQSNSEGDPVNRIHQAQKDGVFGIIINPAAYTHTSVAIRDALPGAGIPFVDIHYRTRIRERNSGITPTSATRLSWIWTPNVRGTSVFLPSSFSARWTFSMFCRRRP